MFPGSRVIAAAKANTSNAFSLPQGPLSSANLFVGTQPGGPIFGLETGNPVDTAVAYLPSATAPNGDNITVGAGAYPDWGGGSAALIAALPVDFPINPAP
jgi:hypothetical protein